MDATTHTADDELHDWVDGRLDDVTRARAARHDAACAACHARAAALRALLAAARAAPAEVAPPDPDAMERAILARLAAGAGREASARVLPLRAAPRAPWPRRPAALAAAALLLVAGSSLVTARLVRRERAPAVARAEPAPAPSAAVPVLSVMQRESLLRETDHTLAALRAAAAAGDDVLAAETLRVLERSLATIDGAIAEAEAALARDPANGALAALLARTYERKLEAVRRGAALGSRS